MVMKAKLTLEQRKSLHSTEYVAIYQKKSQVKLRNLVDRMELDINSDVVDFGCGDAEIARHLKDRIKSYSGIDFSEEFIEAAMQKMKLWNASNVFLECGSIVDFSTRNIASFDVGLALDISEHIYDAEWQDIVNAMFRCLRAGGRFYLHTPNAEFFLEVLKERKILLSQSPEHIAIRNAKSNVDFLERAGFENITVDFIPHYNIMRVIHPLSLMPAVGRYFKARLFISARKPI